MQYYKLCRNCDGKKSHYIMVNTSGNTRDYEHKCPKCGTIWNECDDE